MHYFALQERLVISLQTRILDTEALPEIANLAQMATNKGDVTWAIDKVATKP